MKGTPVIASGYTSEAADGVIERHTPATVKESHTDLYDDLSNDFVVTAEKIDIALKDEDSTSDIRVALSTQDVMKSENYI